MTRDGKGPSKRWQYCKADFPDLFNTNASIVRDLAKAVADAAPEANVLVISNPVSISLSSKQKPSDKYTTGKLDCSNLRRSIQEQGRLQP